MAQNMIGSHLSGPGGINKLYKASDEHCKVVSKTVFTANGAGTTTTIVGANAAPDTDDTNVIRRDEKFRLFDSTGAAKDDQVYRVTDVAVGVSTTVTFTPAAPEATASGDFAKRVTLDDFMDTESMDRRLAEINGTSYSAARLATMSASDKAYALRLEVNGDGL